MTTEIAPASAPLGDYVTPDRVVQTMSDFGKKKAGLSTGNLVVRGIMSGGFLAFATSVSFQVIAEGAPAWVGGLLFPIGFCILILLQFELVTGNFAFVPTALFDGRVSFGRMMRNWTWVFIGNLIGSLLYAFALYASLTKFGSVDPGPLAEVLVHKAESKTVAYQEVGVAAGMGAAFVKAILCNWMVATGTVMALVSTSTVGKIVGMWLPISAFFVMGYEHSVVNMFVIPSGILFGDSVTIGDWWVWNQVVVTLGNIVGALVLVAMVLYFAHGAKNAKKA